MRPDHYGVRSYSEKSFFGIKYKNYYDINIIDHRFIFSNNSNEEKECVLFGSNFFLNKSRYGNPEGIEIRMDMLPENYSHFLHCLIGSKDVFHINKLRIHVSPLDNSDEKDVRHKDILQTMTVVHCGLSGTMSTYPLDISKWYNKKQVHKDIVEKEFNLTLNGNVYIKFNVSPKRNIYFSFQGNIIK